MVFPDLFVAIGSVYPEVERKLPPTLSTLPASCSVTWGWEIRGTARGSRAAFSEAHSSRGCAFGQDFDNDGDMDIWVMNMNEPPSLLRNDVSTGGHWLKVLLIGVKTNRSAIGTRGRTRYGTRRQAQEVIAQFSFYSANYCLL
jgi:hypothetical protein